jgi:hypothetical protein
MQLKSQPSQRVNARLRHPMCIGNRRVIENQLCLKRQALALTGIPLE